ncbi:MAG: hypothetical protein QXH32_05500 [Candidatus Caldarchaeum sp.]
MKPEQINQDEVFTIEFPLFRNEEKRFLELFLDLARSATIDSDYLRELVGKHFSPHLKSEHGDRFASCMTQLVEIGDKQSLRLTLNGHSYELNERNDLMDYINMQIRAATTLESVAKFMVKESSNSYQLLLAAHMVCLFAVLERSTTNNEKKWVKAGNVWEKMEQILEEMYELKLGWDLLGRIFESDPSLLGKLYEKLEKGKGNSYTLQAYDPEYKWIIVTLGEYEKQLLKIFNSVIDEQAGPKHGVLHKKCWVNEHKKVIYLEKPQRSGVKELTPFLFEISYVELPQWFNLYVHYVLRKKLIEMGKASGLLATTNVVIAMDEQAKSEQELDILLIDIRDNSIGIIECTISGSQKELKEKEQKINGVKIELEKSGFNVRVAEAVTPSPTLQNKIEEVAKKLV